MLRASTTISDHSAPTMKATFDSMKANADRTAPDTDHGTWKSNSQFFNKGETGQWRGVLSDDNLRLYNRVTAERYDPAMIDWLENGGQVSA